MTNKIAFMPGMNMLKWEPERICDCVREAGYDAIEVQTDLLCVDKKTDSERARFMRAVEASGLTVSEAVLQRDFVLLDEDARKEQIAHVIRNMKMLADCGIQIANMFTGPVPWGQNPLVINKHVSEGTAWKWVFEAFDQIVAVAEQINLKIAVENVFGMMAHNLYTNKFFQSHYNSPMLGVNLDPSHDVLDGIMDMNFLIESWGIDKIFHVHIKDAVGIQTPGKFLFPLIGEGEVNWTDFFGKLKQIGYTGAMSVEFESWAYIRNTLDGKYELGAPLCRQAVAKLLENV